MMGNIVYDGPHRRIRWAIDSRGRMPAADFFDGLPDSKQASFMALFQLFSDKGFIENREHFRKLRGEIWEFKRSQARMPCFSSECGVVVVTHGFVKKQQKTPDVEIERADRIRQEHLERCDKCDGRDCL